jgi:hypothetical protein
MMNTLKATFADEEGVMYDNDDDAIFFCKGVVETVKNELGS